MHNDIRKTELTEWVNLYTADLFSWAFQKTSDRQLSEDLVQETFLAAAEKSASFRNESRPKTWLFGILKNKIAAHYRKTLRLNIAHTPLTGEAVPFFNASGRWEENATPQPWPDDSEHLMDNPAFNRVFDDCVGHLPAVMNACIRLKFLDEKKGEQICRELGLTDANYWQLIHRAKLLLRDCLEKLWFKLS